MPPEAARRVRARPPHGQGAPGAAVDREAEGGGAGDDGDARADGQVEGAAADVLGDLVLEAGEAFGVVDQGLGAIRVELVDVHVQADGSDVAVQRQGAQRRDIDLGAAGEGGAQGHGGVHGADRDPYVAHHQQPQPGAEEDDGHESGRAGPRVRLPYELDRGGRLTGAIAAGQSARGLADRVQDTPDCGGDAGH